MTKTVEFLFDVGSPYSYLAYHALPRIAEARGATIVWTPILVGALFQATGARSPVEIPAKARYTLTDLQRWARHFGVKFAMNPAFPINTLPLMRGATAMQMRGEAEFQRYLAAVFDAMFGTPRNMGDPAVVAEVLSAAGFDVAEFQSLIQSQPVKDKLRADTERAVARGAFGAPTFFVGDQMYWGQDRLGFVEAALA